jgi:hypothetical protein
MSLCSRLRQEWASFVVMSEMMAVENSNHYENDAIFFFFAEKFDAGNSILR